MIAQQIEWGSYSWNGEVEVWPHGNADHGPQLLTKCKTAFIPASTDAESLLKMKSKQKKTSVRI